MSMHVDLPQQATITTQISTHPFDSLPHHQLIEKPVKPDVEAWLQQTVRYDLVLQRVQYSHPEPSSTMNGHQRLIVDSAYEAYKDALDRVSEADYEFFATIAGVAVAVVKTYFRQGPQRERRERERAKETERKSIKGASSKEPVRQEKSSESPRATMGTMIESDDHITIRRVIHPKQRLLQDTSCRIFAPRWDVDLCRNCAIHKDRDQCLFMNFRCIDKSAAGTDFSRRNRDYRNPDFLSDGQPDRALLTNTEGLGKDQSTYILSYIHKFALSLVKAQVSHVLGASITKATIKGAPQARKDYVRRSRLQVQYCNLCRGSIVSACWICSSCGYLLCQECTPDPGISTLCTKRRAHIPAQFFPCGRFQLSTLIDVLNSLQTAARHMSPDLRLNAETPTVKMATALRPVGGTSDEVRCRSPICVSELSIDEFRSYWKRGEVIVQTDVASGLKKDWSPSYLKSQYGFLPVQAQSYIPEEKELPDYKTLTEFLESSFSNQGGEPQWKLMKWPTDTAFQDTLPDLYEDLLGALPLSAYTHPQGVFNLMRFVPSILAGETRGPKLHMCGDSTGTAPECSPHTASHRASVIWDIYRAEDRSTFLQYFQKAMSRHDRRFSKIPFMFSKYYLSPKQRRDLFSKTGVRPYRVLQQAGDSVMIPAGCVYQARFVRDSVLVEVNFATPERFSAMIQRNDEERSHNQVVKLRRDIMTETLMAKNILFYAAVSTTM
ncbi:hypothetical protein BGX28_005294 [Mortierella sp. GBA30]|nr:hypothetical protein BGX28_005294 [Mortierella sp. GBA30]